MNKRKKRRVIAYFLRTIVALVVSMCLILMVCGCLYIHEHLHPVKVEAAMDAISGRSDVSFAQVLENSKYTILLDAGHGGKDQGTCSGDVLEKDINLSVTLMLKDDLEKRGATVFLTRDEDEFLELSERTDLANNSKIDLFVSIHCNYCKESSAVSGLECYSYTETSSGRKYAEYVIDYLKQETSVETRGSKFEDFYVLRNTQAPAVLIELGYMSNAMECEKLCDKDYRKQLSAGLADAILDGLRNENKLGE